MTATVTVADPDPGWPALYAAEAGRLRAALGPALREIEHVGSTAVPGLAAKPILDVMAAVDALGDAEARLPVLMGLGYAPRITGMTGRLFFQRLGGGDLPAANLHVVTLASWPARKERRFRDRLLAVPAEAAAYAALKRDLARTLGHDPDAYTRAKTDLIQAIMDRAADEDGRPRERVWED